MNPTFLDMPFKKFIEASMRLSHTQIHELLSDLEVKGEQISVNLDRVNRKYQDKIIKAFPGGIEEYLLIEKQREEELALLRAAAEELVDEKAIEMFKLIFLSPKT